MAAPILLAWIELSRGAFQLGKPKIRIVTEAARSARRIQNDALPNAFRPQLGVARRIDERQNSSIARAARRGRRVGKRGQKLRIIRGIVGLGSGVAGRIYAGRAAERIDLQPRVVGDCRTAGRSRRMAPLEQGVGEEARAGFLRRRDAELRLSHGLKRHSGEQGAKLAQFACIAGGEDQARVSHAR